TDVPKDLPISSPLLLSQGSPSTFKSYSDMKNRIYFLMILVLTSCNSLELNPLSEGSSENWYRDGTEVEMAVSYLFSGGRFYNYEYFQGTYTDRHTDDWTRRLEVTEI